MNLIGSNPLHKLYGLYCAMVHTFMYMELQILDDYSVIILILEVQIYCCFSLHCSSMITKKNIKLYQYICFHLARKKY